MLILSSVFLVFAIALEWTEEYPGSIKKPVPVHWVGIICKIVELLLGVGNWALSDKNDYTMVLYFTKGVVTALEIPVKGYLIVQYVPRTTLATRTDWFNLLGPSILALLITIMDTVREFAIDSGRG